MEHCKASSSRSSSQLHLIKFTSQLSKGPTGVERRKHQLTFLAAQARANDVKLRAQWAASAESRRVAKQRYGFG
jgi:proline-rich protein PRCC